MKKEEWNHREHRKIKREKFEIPSTKHETNINDQNTKSKTI
jgi:hypothetical protein